MKKSVLCGLVLLGALGTAAGAFGYSSKSKLKNLKQRVSGEITHIDEDSFAAWSGYSGGNPNFENFRVKVNDELTYKLIHLGPSSYKVGDKIDLEVKRLYKGGISVRDLNHLLTRFHNSQTGYVKADGLIIENLPSNIRNYLFPR